MLSGFAFRRSAGSRSWGLSALASRNFSNPIVLVVWSSGFGNDWERHDVRANIATILNSEYYRGLKKSLLPGIVCR